jgi:hypothetical protein
MTTDTPVQTWLNKLNSTNTQYLDIKINRQGQFIIHNVYDSYLCWLTPGATPGTQNFNWVWIAKAQSPPVQTTALYRNNDFWGLSWVNTGHYKNDEFGFLPNCNLVRFNYDFPHIENLNVNNTVYPAGVTAQVRGFSPEGHIITHCDFYLWNVGGYWTHLGTRAGDGTSDFIFTLTFSVTDGSHILGFTVHDDQTFNTTLALNDVSAHWFVTNTAPVVTIEEPTDFEIPEGSAIQGLVTSDAIAVEVQIVPGQTAWTPAVYTPGGWDWYYIIPDGITGTQRFYARAYDGILYSPIVFRDYNIIEDVEPPEPEPEPEPTPTPIPGPSPAPAGEEKTFWERLGDITVPVQFVTVFLSLILVLLSLYVWGQNRQRRNN